MSSEHQSSITVQNRSFTLYYTTKHATNDEARYRSTLAARSSCFPVPLNQIFYHVPKNFPKTPLRVKRRHSLRSQSFREKKRVHTSQRGGPLVARAPALASSPRRCLFSIVGWHPATRIPELLGPTINASSTSACCQLGTCALALYAFPPHLAPVLSHACLPSPSFPILPKHACVPSRCRSRRVRVLRVPSRYKRHGARRQRIERLNQGTSRELATGPGDDDEQCQGHQSAAADCTGHCRADNDAESELGWQ